MAPDYKHFGWKYLSNYEVCVAMLTDGLTFTYYISLLAYVVNCSLWKEKLTIALPNLFCPYTDYQVLDTLGKTDDCDVLKQDE